MRLAYLLLPLLAACAVTPRVAQPAPPPAARDLGAVFDCLRASGAALVSAHRGQPTPDAAENSLASFAETLTHGPILIELDIRRSRDGVLVLLHDDTLDRTTSGRGRPGDYDAAALATLTLRDDAGRMTSERLPTFDAALAWARRAGAMLQLDVKRGVAFADVIAATRRVGMAARVIVITYNSEDAALVARLAPEMMISASIPDEAARAGLVEAGVRVDRVLAFTGTRAPAPAMLRALNDAGIEPIVGTLGRAGERLDDRFMADGDGREYVALAAAGAALIASDRPLDAWAALTAAGRDGTRCLKGTN